jgi:hypothetical protein
MALVHKSYKHLGLEANALIGTLSELRFILAGNCYKPDGMASIQQWPECQATLMHGLYSGQPRRGKRKPVIV